MVHKYNIVVTARLPDNSSVYSAESHAILLALDFIDTYDFNRFVVFSDSLSCLEAIHNIKWASPMICHILEKCHFVSLVGKEIHFCWVPSHVGITGNERADVEAKAALQFPISDCKVPHCDYKQMITSQLTKIWQTQWDQADFNKLHSIKKVIGPTKFQGISRRRDEVVLHRARIGHTHVTHSYLLKAEDQPQCSSCLCSLSVRHILIDCPCLASSWQKYFNVGSLYELFSQVSVFNLTSFLREMDLYQRF